ncbi:PTS system, lactose/cellobiose family IIC component [Enterococcus moraviensis ATCC BAA-383]|uniref:Permease IIC component n=1 Tax=Enterococcus moraviensis ATCC BAA-383 TaxID=1158609 RepID=R2U2E1_9ENTE|nr:PTS transporter subunit EIIC [Enterococcus moraviensis]EOI06907.1 PTS system, lactose/cellobiose family IIC component [Enterococcus moraviensis ATCC BAA-383]EOT65250.1 PTS system, cellobiose-specific IIC component [Enterococcus moraviensis ATCC BAA-383]
MQKFNDIIDRSLVPIATKLNNQRHIAAVRDAFMLIFPLTISASLVILVNNILFSNDSFVVQLLRLSSVFPNLEDAQQVLSSVANGTINIMSIFITYLVAQILAKHFEADSTLVGLTSIASFMILYPKPFNADDMNVISTQYLGAQGLFVAMIVGCLVGEFLPKLFKVKRLQIKMPEMVPPAVSRSFSSMIPIVIVVGISAIINFLVLMIAPEGVNELIYKGIQSPLRDLGGNVVGVMLLAFIQTLLFSIGIHGPNTLNAVRSAIFTEQDLANLDFINKGGSLWDVPYKETWGILNDMFANMGGTGMTMGLIIAIFIASRRPEQREIAKMSLVPGIFQINEPIIFGLPIVLNPLLIVPFILVPMVNIMIGYFVTVVWPIMPSPAIGVPWTTPGIINLFLGTGGNIVAVLVGVICLAVSVCIYLPFVIASNRAQKIDL